MLRERSRGNRGVPGRMVNDSKSGMRWGCRTGEDQSTRDLVAMYLHLYSWSSERVIEEIEEWHAQVYLLVCEKSNHGRREMNSENMTVVQIRDEVVWTRVVAVEVEMKKFQVLYWSKDRLSAKQMTSHPVKVTYNDKFLKWRYLFNSIFADKDSNSRTNPVSLEGKCARLQW